MFTGIIETTGQIKKIETAGTNKSFWIDSSIGKELKIDQSLAHNGVCLTVEETILNIHKVTAIEETLCKTNLDILQEGDEINLERCMQMNGRLDGHLVQGHVDCTAVCTEKKELKGSWEFSFRFPENFAHLVIDKGSVCINGISLTCFNVANNTFTVAIIPYTFKHTNMQHVQPQTLVNIEFDIIGKYIFRRQATEQQRLSPTVG
jgi:riboflavin synthase